MLLKILRALSTLCVRKMKLKFKKLLARKDCNCRNKYKIAQEFDIQVLRGQIDILVY